MTVIFKDYRKSAKRKLRRGLVAGLEGSVSDFVDRLKVSVDTPYPPVSSPGSAPHKRTGAFQAGLTYEIDRDAIESVAGSDGPDASLKKPGAPQAYPTYLELGTRKMAARPWLVVGLQRGSERIVRTFAKFSARFLK